MPQDSGFRAGDRFYRSLDAIYRIHDDLYHLEEAVLQSTIAQIKLAKLRSQSGLGATIAAVLAGVPILISVSPLDWQSASTIWVIVVSIGLLAFLIYQVVAAGKSSKDLEEAEKLADQGPLRKRLDYQLEKINSYGHRITLLEDLRVALKLELNSATDDAQKRLWRDRSTRYEEIQEECMDEIRAVVRDSKAMIGTGLRTVDEHAQLLDWASPFLTEDK